MSLQIIYRADNDYLLAYANDGSGDTRGLLLGSVSLSLVLQSPASKSHFVELMEDVFETLLRYAPTSHTIQ